MSAGDPPRPSLRYLAKLTDDNGVVEHALYEGPRREYGYCTDDAGRLLALASRMAEDRNAERLAHVALGFLERAHVGGGNFHLRQRGDGSWTSDSPSDDAAARALLGLGTAAARAPWLDVRRGALTLFTQAADFETVHLRAIAYAALGAAELLRVQPGHAGAQRLLERATALVQDSGRDESWPWPESRLTYDNAIIPEASLEVAIIQHDAVRAREALAQLRWLVERQRREGHFSFTPTGGADAATVAPLFDQQPIEAWSLASACTRAFTLTHDYRWAQAVEGAAAWFLGANDVGVALFDAGTGGCYDGLEATGVNLNEGAESAMALVATMLFRHEVHTPTLVGLA